MKPTIVQLGKHGSIGRVIAFDDAFDDYSEAGGRLRQKLADRRSDKRAKKTQRKIEKIQGKSQVQQARIQKRADAQSFRQGKRTNKVVAKTERKQIKRDFRNSGSEQLPDDTGNTGQEVLDENTQYEQPYEVPYENGTTGQDFESQDNNSQDVQDGQTDYGMSSGQDWEGGPPNTSEDDLFDQDGNYIDSSDSSNEVSEDDTLDYSFNGVMGAEDFYSRLTDNDKKVLEVTPELEGVATKIEWHKENLSRLRVQRARLLGEGRYTGDVEEKMRDSTQRMKELQNILHKYANFEGEFTDGLDSNAIEFFNASGNSNPSRGQKRKRFLQIGKAQGLATQTRNNYLMKKQGKTQQVYGGDTTPVDIELNPTIEPQRIEVPEDNSSNANGTGLVGLDQANDFDAPPTRVIEITSNATGMGSGVKVNWAAIGLGVAIATFAIAVWGVEGKYKLVK